MRVRLPIVRAIIAVVLGCGVYSPSMAVRAATNEPPQTGRTGVATALPGVPVPGGKPCVVQLFSDVTFTDARPRTFAYHPPSTCRGPWARVVLVADWSVTSGRQFDRTASLWIGNVNVFFGSTQEPSADISPHWQVQRDVTDYSTWLRRPHAGHTKLINVVNATYTGVITGSAKLLFYPGRPPQVPDMVVSLSTHPHGGLDVVEPGKPRAGRTFVLPRNMVAIYMDVFAESQAGDEFWAFCVPDKVASRLKACGGSGFRQTMVYVDGREAGVAPVYPWIYSGGAGPALWRPIPGVQTLNFRPFRVNLTPFAAVLDDGRPHAITLGVVRAQSHFALVANLLIYRDPDRAVVTGALRRADLRNTPGQRDRVDAERAGRTRVDTTSRQVFDAEGYVDTSQGRVDTHVHERMDFSSRQAFTITPDRYRQQTDLVSGTQVESRIAHKGSKRVLRREYSYALHFDDDQRTGGHGHKHESMRATQSYLRKRSLHRGDRQVYSDSLSNTVTPSVRYLGRITGGVASVDPWTSAQHFRYGNSLGACFDRRIRSHRHELVSVNDGMACGGRNHYRWTPDMRHHVDPSAPRGSEAALWSD